MGRDPEAAGVSGTGRVADRLAPLVLPDLTGRRAVVTGASNGIGFATATALAGAGAEVVLAVRDPGRGEAAMERIRDTHPDASVRVEIVELGSLVSIAEFTSRMAEDPVDLLINNAGTSSNDPQARTADGFELQVGVNYLGAWAVTAGLWPALRAADAARVVMLGSMVSARGRIEADFGRPTGSTFRSYSDSKLATVVLAGELRRRCARAGVGVTATAAHPGWCQTAIFDADGPPRAITLIGRVSRAIQSARDGAQPVLLAATDRHPGAYYGPTRRGGASGPPGPARLPARALVPGLGERLWDLSIELTGVAFEP